jgi:hypothetical protein
MKISLNSISVPKGTVDASTAASDDRRPPTNVSNDSWRQGDQDSIFGRSRHGRRWPESLSLSLVRGEI